MVLSGLGATYERMGNLVAAERVYDQLILRYAAQQSTYRRVGLFWGSIKRYGKAIAIFNRGLKEYPNDVVLLRGKRTALQRLGKIKEAVSVAQRIVSLIPKSGSALFYLASLQQDAGLFLLAIENYRAILKINSNHFGTLNNLAVLLTKTGSADQALPYAEKARKLEPERSDTADTLGWTLFRSGQRQQGIEELRRAHNLAPKGAAPLYHLGLAYWEMKNADQAREYLSRAVKQLKTGSRMAKHAQNVLAGMDGP